MLESLAEEEKAEGQHRKRCRGRKGRRSEPEVVQRQKKQMLESLIEAEESRRSEPEAVLQKAEKASAESLTEALPRIKRR